MNRGLVEDDRSLRSKHTGSCAIYSGGKSGWLAMDRVLVEDDGSLRSKHTIEEYCWGDRAPD
jgi:hypothetical protein